MGESRTSDIDSDPREVRSSKNPLMCKANDKTGFVETKGPQKTTYRFNIPIGGSFTVTHRSIISKVHAPLRDSA